MADGKWVMTEDDSKRAILRHSSKAGASVSGHKVCQQTDDTFMGTDGRKVL